VTYPDSLLSTFEMEALVGASKTYAIRLRRKGTINNLDVSSGTGGFTSLQLEVNKSGESAMLPIPFNSAAPGADFPNGRIVGTISPVDVCARVGTYQCAITGVVSGVTQPIAIGSIEVLPRPISGPIPMPGGAYYNSSNLALEVNASISTPIPQGTPVCRTPAGLVPATASASGVFEADGIALVTIPPSDPGLIMLAGSLQLADWTAIAGTVGLTIGVPYFLSATAGQITTVEPARPGSALLELIGQSEDGVTLDLQIGQYQIDI
jgi:hypothetical protein